ncbi:MAG: DUF7332 family protein [Halohasta sp.]
MVSRASLLALVCCCLLLSSPLSAAVAAQSTVSDGEPSNGSETGPTESGAADGCFPDDGYEFTIGTEGPEIRMVLHLSLLTNPVSPGAFGVELAGSIDGPPIIELRTGVLSEGIDSPTEFLNDPFGPFSIAYDYQFQLPMFGSGFDHEESDPPIDGPVNGTDC